MAHSDLRLETTNKQILKIALPISLAILVPQLNFITNNIFLGHHSRQALAIASITGVYYLIFAMIGYGLNNGLQALISRRAGENRPEEIGKLFGQGVFISLSIAFFGILLTWFAAPMILRQVVHDPSTAEAAIEFLKIRIWGLPFLYIYQMRNALLVGTNQSKYLVIGTASEAVCNIIFDYLLIFGALGFPQMGFNGAAVASIIAEFTGMFVIFLVIHKKGITKRFGLFNHFRWNTEIAVQILNISLPLVLQLAISIISWEFFYILIEHHGEMALAVSNVMRNIFGMMGCIAWAFAATSATMVSNVIGQGKVDVVVPLINRIVKLSVISAAFLCTVVNVFVRPILSIYGQNAEFIEAAIPVVRIITVAMLLMAVGVVWLNALIGTGNSRVTLVIEIITIVLYCVYVYVVLEKLRLPITIGWMSEWLYWISLFSLSYFYIRTGKWKNKKI